MHVLWDSPSVVIPQVLWQRPQNPFVCCQASSSPLQQSDRPDQVVDPGVEAWVRKTIWNHPKVYEPGIISTALIEYVGCPHGWSRWKDWGLALDLDRS